MNRDAIRQSKPGNVIDLGRYRKKKQLGRLVRFFRDNVKFWFFTLGSVVERGFDRLLWLFLLQQRSEDRIEHYEYHRGYENERL